ncbi:MAG TPA: alpha/beta hydrolase [Gaiellaceae bacterium]
MTELAVAHRGIELAVQVSGEGEPPLVLLHGGGDNLATWSGLVPLLADEFRVVAFDAAGHGRSTTPEDVSVEDFVDQIDSVAHALELRRAILVGHSWGGATALRHAASGRALAAGVVAIDPGPWQLGPRLPPFDPAHTEARGYGWTGTTAELEALVQEWLAEAEAEAPDEPRDVVEATFRRSFEIDASGLWHRKPELAFMSKFGPLVRHPDAMLTPALLDTLASPALLLAAEDGLVGAAAGVKVKRVPGGHYVHWTNPDRVAAAIRRFARNSSA